MKTVKINTKAIPKVEVRVLCSAFLEAVERFYKDPANLDAFDKWQKEREER